VEKERSHIISLLVSAFIMFCIITGSSIMHDNIHKSYHKHEADTIVEISVDHNSEFFTQECEIIESDENDIPFCYDIIENFIQISPGDILTPPPEA
jgi:hypothetical protein